MVCRIGNKHMIKAEGGRHETKWLAADDSHAMYNYFCFTNGEHKNCWIFYRQKGGSRSKMPGRHEGVNLHVCLDHLASGFGFRATNDE
jgi:hypothetical protein